MSVQQPTANRVSIQTLGNFIHEVKRTELQRFQCQFKELFGDDFMTAFNPRFEDSGICEGMAVFNIDGFDCAVVGPLDDQGINGMIGIDGWFGDIPGPEEAIGTNLKLRILVTLYRMVTREAKEKQLATA
jgi:hypothetical protein